MRRAPEQLAATVKWRAKIRAGPVRSDQVGFVMEVSGEYRAAAASYADASQTVARGVTVITEIITRMIPAPSSL